MATIPATLPLERAIKLVLWVFKYYAIKLVTAEKVAATIVLTAINPYWYCAFYPYVLEPLIKIKIAIVKIIDPYPILIGEWCGNIPGWTLPS